MTDRRAPASAENKKIHRFEADATEVVRQHDVVYRQPSRRGADGLPLGNGDLALQVDGSGSQLFDGFVMKTDVWDRGAEMADPHEWHLGWAEVLEARGEQDRMEQLEQIERSKRYGSSTERRVMPKTLGAMRLGAFAGSRELSAVDDLCDFEQTLSLYDAEVRTKYSWARALSSEITTRVLSHRNVATLEVKDLALDEATPVTRRFALHRGPDPRLPTVPSFGSDGDRFWLRYEFPGGFEYVLAGVTNAEGSRIVTAADSIGVEFDIRGAVTTRIQISAATSDESSDPLAHALGLLDASREEDVQEQTKRHRGWWHEYWERSVVLLPDVDVESYWYTSLYMLGRSQRGELPAWLLWADEENEVAWNGPFWDIMANNFLGCFAANHPELAEPYLRFHFDILPAAKRIATELYDSEGARYPHAYGPDGLELGVLWFRLMHFSSAYVSLIFWWRFVYTWDTEFLRTRAYPVMKECARFYESWLEPDADGVLHTPGPTCLFNEVLWREAFDVIDNPLELGLIKRLLLSLDEAAGHLGVDEDDRENWRKMAASLAEPPVHSGVFVEYEGQIPGAQPIWTVDMLGAVFPAATVSNPEVALSTVRQVMFELGNLDRHDVAFGASAAAYEGIGDESSEALTTTQVMACPLLSAAASWSGDGATAQEALELHLLHHALPNGCFGEDRTASPYAADSLLPTFALTENCGDYMAAVNEMVIKSVPDGIITVFMGILADQCAAFRSLRAVGGFLVTSELRDGEVCYVGIESEHGRKCLVATPRSWNSTEVQVRAFPTLELISHSISDDGVVVFGTEPGQSYVVDRVGTPWETIPVCALPNARGPRRYLGLPESVAAPPSESRATDE